MPRHPVLDLHTMNASISSVISDPFFLSLGAIHPRGGGLTGCSERTTTAASKAEKMDLTIAELVEMFQAALEAGLKNFVDPTDTHLQRNGGGRYDGNSGEGSATPEHDKYPSGHSSLTGGGKERGVTSKPPGWVDVVYGVLVPGLQGLVDRITRVHLGLASTSSTPRRRPDAHLNGADKNTLALVATEEFNAQHTGESIRSSITRRRSTKHDDLHSSGLFPVNPDQARSALWALLHPIVSVGLVGHLGAEACLFAWDQAVIGGFEVMLPRITAMLLVAAGDKLEACGTFSTMSDAFLSHVHLVSVRERRGGRQDIFFWSTSESEVACVPYES